LTPSPAGRPPGERDRLLRLEPSGYMGLAAKLAREI